MKVGRWTQVCLECGEVLKSCRCRVILELRRRRLAEIGLN